MIEKESGESDAIIIPSSAAEAWALVYIDVAEKLDAEEKHNAIEDRDGSALPAA